MTTQIITLLTDLGTTDAYVGIVKGTLLARAPKAQIVDLSHAAESGSLYTAAYLLAAAFPYFPANTVHLVLIDPGSTDRRKLLAAAVERQYLVAPDDGVASLLLDEHPPEKLVTVESANFLLPTVRHTFHSRLIYAPVAAALASGAVPLEQLGSPLKQWTPLPHAIASTESDGSVRGQVVHIDRFGNLVTNIRAAQLPAHPKITVADHVIDHISDSYGDVDVGRLLAIIGSTGNLEIGMNRCRAADQLIVSISHQVRVEPA